MPLDNMNCSLSIPEFCKIPRSGYVILSLKRRKNCSIALLLPFVFHYSEAAGPVAGKRGTVDAKLCSCTKKSDGEALPLL